MWREINRFYETQNWVGLTNYVTQPFTFFYLKRTTLNSNPNIECPVARDWNVQLTMMLPELFLKEHSFQQYGEWYDCKFRHLQNHMKTNQRARSNRWRLSSIDKLWREWKRPDRIQQNWNPDSSWEIQLRHHLECQRVWLSSCQQTCFQIDASVEPHEGSHMLPSDAN